MLRVLDLFSGIGGFSLGLERTGGFETVAFCEIDPFCRQVLAKHWPDVPIHEDVRSLNGDAIGPVDVVCGGYPCQPFSLAGKRAGQEDDRHLWPEMYRIMDELRPAWFIGENVAGHVSMGTSRWASTTCFLTWKPSVTPQGRLLFRLVPSTPRTDETAFGLWQTPVSDDAVERTEGKFNSRGEPKLSAQVKLLPTPTANEGARNKSASPNAAIRPSLGMMAKHGLWPTPDGGAAKGPGVSSSATRSRLGGSLNPMWVSWLMGYPLDWLDLEG